MLRIALSVVSRFSRVLATRSYSTRLRFQSSFKSSTYSFGSKQLGFVVETSSWARRSDYAKRLPEDGIFCVYSDGSRRPEGIGTAAVHLPSLSNEISTKSYPSIPVIVRRSYLGPLNSYPWVLEAELTGAVMALDIVDSYRVKDAAILIDCHSAIQALMDFGATQFCSKPTLKRTERLSNDSKWLVGEFHHKYLELKKLERLRIVWVPGHSGVEGNELADLEAKKAARLLLALKTPAFI
ncbi:hypothetical protein C8J56DRAFT_1118522 [Mycena floridula]|nr:hypothetical protein C8J56DRAFT_1118522 [Mycena floridula]